MSIITDATITAHDVHEDVLALLVQPIPGDDREQVFSQVAADGFGLYAAAFNFVRPIVLEEWFLTLPWSDADCAVLTAWGEDDDLVVVTVFGGNIVVNRSDPNYGNALRHRLVTVPLVVRGSA